MITTSGWKKISNIVVILLLGHFSFLMLQITLRYIPFSTTASFLQIKQTEVEEYSYYLPVFYTHVYTAVFCLLAGFTQFNSFIRKQYTWLHRLSGYLYVAVVILFAAPSGLVMGLHANGGIIAVFFFVTLSVLWWWFTYRAVDCIRKGDVPKHRRFMVRSFALALSAITLRLWKVILVYLFQPSPMDVYVVVAGLGWIPNLIIAEIILKKYNNE